MVFFLPFIVAVATAWFGISTNKVTTRTIHIAGGIANLIFRFSKKGEKLGHGGNSNFIIVTFCDRVISHDKPQVVSRK